jgi:hypothetical protein
VLVDRALAQRPVRLVSISADTIEVSDANGHVQTVSRSQVLALIPPLTDLDQPVVDEHQLTQRMPDAERQRPVGRLDLVDGQTLPGVLSSGAPSRPGDKGERLVWASKLFGPVSLPLEAVGTVLFAPDRADLLHPGPTPLEDTVTLINGDRAEGFVAGVDASVRLEKGGKTSQLPVARVVAIQFANPPKPAQGAWVWLYDGTAAAVSEVSADSAGHVTITGRLAGLAKQPQASMDANDLRAISFDAGALRPLAGAPLTVSEPHLATGPAPRRWIPPLSVPDNHGAPLGAVDIEIPGPMTVEWTLPHGASRLGTTVEMPPSARVWGDCELIVESLAGPKTTQIAKVHLCGESPTADLSLAITGASKLRMTIDPGPTGPVEDRVVLRRPVVLVEDSRKP